MFQNRIKRAQASLNEFEIDALLVTNVYNILYLSGVSSFSIEEREARILLTKKNIYLFTDARYTEMVKIKSPFIKLIEVTFQNTFLSSLKTILKNEKIKSVGFEEENLTYKESADLEKIAAIEFIPTTDIIEELREIKDKEEIENIKKACKLTDSAFDFIIPHLKAGVTELEIKFILENYMRSKGASLAFESIVAFGKNSAIPHHLSTNYELRTTDVILLDFGAKVNGYCADFTRMVFLGEPNAQIKKMYEANLATQLNAIEDLKKHIQTTFKADSVHKNANLNLKKEGFPPIPHGLGHGVGLQVHEHPTLSPYTESELKPGMVVTVEPGIYDVKLCGIRIEDTVLLTPTGIEILTKSSKKLMII